jgi:hypothetical protein
MGSVSLLQGRCPKMSQTEGRLSSKQRAGIAALLEGMTIQGASSRVGVHRRTMARWLRDKAFCDELRAQSQGALAASRSRFALLFDEALAVLFLALRGGEPCDAERWAVGLVMRYAAQLSTYFDLEDRVTQLEAKSDVEA